MIIPYIWQNIYLTLKTIARSLLGFLFAFGKTTYSFAPLVSCSPFTIPYSLIFTSKFMNQIGLLYEEDQ
ncbi:hypothetical protein NIES4106_55710 (plasmid) [Fischerella sp. NIES-4106]|nr:hypothetical protein NIES4106_55710 [Fischerella sp. NIES-4106]